MRNDPSPAPIRRAFRSAAASVLAALVPAAASAHQQGTTQPNIVFIISDDAGWADFGFNDQGNGEIPTPALDSIADRGRWFRAAYTAPVCSPSRARTFLGQHNQRTGYDNNNPASLNAADSVVEGLLLEDTTMFERLGDAGYHVGYFGKWHLGTEQDVVQGGAVINEGNLPVRHGIDYFWGLTSGSRNYFFGNESNYTKVIREMTLDPQTNLITDTNLESAYPAGAYVTDVTADEVADYIGSRATTGQPFFAVASFTAPHGPLQATQEYFTRVDNLGLGYTGNRRTYAAMMIGLDDGVQTIIDSLEDPNGDGDTSDSIIDNTVICFMNDNGGETANTARNFPLRGKKSDTFDGGIRVMMSMAGPGIPTTGESFDFAVDSVDLTPTFLALAGQPIGPSDFTDGVDLLPFLNGIQTGPPRDNFFVRGNNPIVAGARAGDFKLTIENIGGPFLYDIVGNPAENNVLNNTFPDVVEAMTDIMNSFETQYKKPRWGATDVNPLIDGFVYRAAAVGTGGWTDANAWQAEGGSPATATLFPRDAYANLRLTFPTNASPYTAVSALARPNQLKAIANSITFAGTHTGAGDSAATITGLPILLSNSLGGTPPSVTMDADATGPGEHPAEIALELHAWDDVVLGGAGDQTLIVSGGLFEERAGRSSMKTGSFHLDITGKVDLTGEFAIDQGSVTVRDAGNLGPAMIHVASDAALTLTAPAGGSSPDLLGNASLLDIETPAAAAPAPVTLDFEGVEIVGTVAADGVPLLGEFFDAGSHPQLFSGAGRLRIRGPLDCDGDINNDGYAEFLDTLGFLRALDAAQGCGGGGPALPAGIRVNNEAWSDVPGDGTWDLAAPGTDGSRVWTFSGPLSPEAVTDGPSDLVNAAYRFPAAGATSADYEDPSRTSSTIELWFKADSTGPQQILWEAGGGGRGAALLVEGGQLHLDVKNGSPSVVRISTPITTGWHQAVASINVNTGELKLFLDGQPATSGTTGSADRWAGGNPSGLGQVTSSMVGNLTPAPFSGLIAVYRFYQNTLLTNAQVQTAYDSVILAAEPCPTAVDLNSDGQLDASDVLLHLQSLEACE
ncbi:MAG: sulfatase-like hydrolase/transferase [Planctomycetota bacterium]